MAAVEQRPHPPGGGESYTFAAAPRAVSNRRRYREPAVIDVMPSLAQTANIMFDRRVVRGNTYAAQLIPVINPLEETDVRPAKTTKRHSSSNRSVKPRTPEPVEGRRHMDVQTEVYLEELTDKVPEATIDTQTDPFLDRPMTPLYVPQKSGVDTETQIEEGDLFDFDFEVEPILEVLVGKTLEQGLMEVLEEEELAAMRAHQEHFEAVRTAELVATQRMEAAEQRRLAEKERRLAQERQRLLHHKEVKEKVAAQTFARRYLSGLVGGVFEELRVAGVFYDPVEHEVTRAFMPHLLNQAAEELASATRARTAVRALVEAALAGAATAAAEAEKARAAALIEEQAARAAEEVRRQLAEQEAARRQSERPTALLKALLDAGLLQEEAREEAWNDLVNQAAQEGGVPATDSLLLERLLADGTVSEEQVNEAESRLKAEGTL